jgi:hypothetical protein
MKASEALIVWDTEPEPAVWVGPLGMDPSCLLYSGGAAYAVRHVMGGKQQLAAVLWEFKVLTVDFGIPAKIVHEAFLAIDEYREAIERSEAALLDPVLLRKASAAFQKAG